MDVSDEIVRQFWQDALDSYDPARPPVDPDDITVNPYRDLLRKYMRLVKMFSGRTYVSWAGHGDQDGILFTDAEQAALERISSEVES